MGTRLILVPILLTLTHWVKDFMNWCLSQSTLPHIPKIQTRPPSHNPYLVLRTSSTTHVPTILRSLSEWFIVSAQAEQKGNISLHFLLYGRTGWYIFLGGRTLHLIILSLSSPRDGVHPRTLPSDLEKIYHINKYRDRDWWHPHSRSFPLLRSAICFSSFRSTPYKVSRIIIEEFFT